MLICFCGEKMDPAEPESIMDHRWCVFGKLPEIETARGTLQQMAGILGCRVEDVPDRIMRLREKVRRWEAELAELEGRV